MAQDIEQDASKPKRVSVDGRTVEQHSLREKIEADRYTRAQSAAAAGWKGVRRQIAKPPGGGP